MDWSKTKVLVTGGSGFLGRNMVARLNALNADFTAPNIRAKFGGCETKAFKNWLGTKEFDVIYHFGSNTHIYNGADASIGSIKNIIEYSAEHGAHLIFPSVVAMYGDSKVAGVDAFTECDAPHPLRLYHAAKLVAESLINYRLDGHSYFTIFRISNGYGPFEQVKNSRASLVTKLCDAAINKKEIEVYANGKSMRDYIFVSDIVNAMTDAVEMRAVGTFNLGSGKAISASKLVDVVTKVVGAPPNVKLVDGPFDHINESKIDINKLRSWYGRPMTPIAKGIEQTTNYLRRGLCC